MAKLKTRFAPSPTGHLHVGGARTALFNFVLARKRKGQFVLRIEDTDRARHDESAVERIVADLHWLGIEWDQGVGVGGPDGPYRQSERLEIYRKYVDALIEAGQAYYAFDTPEQLDTMRRRAQDANRTFRYQRPGALPTASEAEKARADGLPAVVRFLCPQGDVTVDDDAFGRVVMPADQVDDFIILKADGWPTYHLANVVDDALMGITYIMRGQEFLGQTWRHKLLREALGFGEIGYCHLPLIMDMAGRKLSKRDGDVEVSAFRGAGYLPETMVNFLALLGWNPGGQIEKFTLDELVEMFDVSRIGRANAKFDRDKLLAFSTHAVAAADTEYLLAAFKDYLALNDTPIPDDDDVLLRGLLEINRGFRTFADIVGKCGILFMPDEAIEYDPKAVKKWLSKGDGAGWAMLQELRGLLGGWSDWSAESLDAMVGALCDEKGIGMGKVAQPIRVALTGRAVSPQFGQTLALLGKEKTLARIDRCLASRPGGGGEG